MKINKYKFSIIVSIIFSFCYFGGQVLALTPSGGVNNFAVTACPSGISNCTVTNSASGAGSPTNATTDTCQQSGSNCLVTQYIDPLVRFLSALVGIVVVISVVIGGIQYSAARDNPQAVGAARKRIGNAILALIVYIFLFAFLSFIIPGGLL